jgi:hypothetical protein
MDVTVKKITSSDSAKAIERALARSTAVIHLTESQRQAILSQADSEDSKSK